VDNSLTEYPDYAVLDLETSVSNIGDDAIGDFPASPHHPGNQIVSAGVKTYGGPVADGENPLDGYYGWYIDQTESHLLHFGKVLNRHDLWVGQNIKFDLLYMMRCVPNIKEVLPYKKIWCTQLAEYLLTGQEVMYASLDFLSEQYGGELKDDKIKEYWDAGVQTEDIPEQELMEYMQGDVLNTEIVFKAQYKKAQELGMLPLIESQMDALLATTEMEYNGMCFNKGLALEYAMQVEDKLKAPLTEVMNTLYDVLMTYPKEHSASSGDQISLVLFGGQYDIIVKVPWLTEDGEEQYIKSGPNKGKLKERNGLQTQYVEGWFVPDPKWRVKKEGFYAVDDFTLKQVRSRTSDEGVVQFIDALLEVRNYQKELSTYLYGFSDLAWPESKMEKRDAHWYTYMTTKYYIHGKIGHVGTTTGRLNSSQPNLQNLSGRDDE